MPGCLGGMSRHLQHAHTVACRRATVSGSGTTVAERARPVVERNTASRPRFRRGLRLVGQWPPTAVGDLHDAAPHAGAAGGARGLERRVRLLHVDPHRRARIVFLDLVVGREVRRASRSHAERWLYRRPGRVASQRRWGRTWGRKTAMVLAPAR